MASPWKTLSFRSHRRRAYVIAFAPVNLERAVSSADCLLAGQLAIHGPGAEKVSRKHVTITVDKVEEGHAVRLFVPLRWSTLSAPPSLTVVF